MNKAQVFRGMKEAGCKVSVLNLEFDTTQSDFGGMVEDFQHICGYSENEAISAANNVLDTEIY